MGWSAATHRFGRQATGPRGVTLLGRTTITIRLLLFVDRADDSWKSALEEEPVKGCPEKLLFGSQDGKRKKEIYCQLPQGHRGNHKNGGHLWHNQTPGQTLDGAISRARMFGLGANQR